MGNSRLPGKNGLILCGKPQIWHVLNRIKRATTFTEIILAIPHESNGGIQIEAAQELKIPVLDYHGDPNNVLHRYVLAADIMDADIVIRIPGDNTFIDPYSIDEVVRRYDDDIPSWDTLTTTLDFDVMGNGYPAGLGAEIYDVRFLQWLDRYYLEPRFREHPHKWAFENEQVRTYKAPPWLDIRLNPKMPHKFSVDTPEEWEWTKRIYEALYPERPNFSIHKVLQFLGETNGK